MTPQALSQTLRQLADFAEIRGAFLDATDWRRLADDLDRADPASVERLTALARSNRLAELPAVPSTLQASFRDLAVGGHAPILRAARAQLPWLLRRLTETAALDSSGAVALARAGVVTRADLDLALEDGRVPSLQPPIENLQSYAAALDTARSRLTLGRAAELLEQLILLLATACPNLENLTPAGDVRRADAVVDSLVVVGAAADPVAALDALADVPTLRVLHRTARRAIVNYQQTEVDLRIAAPDEYGTVLYLATGSRDHLSAMRIRSAALRLCAREADVYAQAGLPWIAPELRQGQDEVAAAAQNTLPDLVSRGDIRGDLHMHTTYSDGRDGLAEMVQMSAALGYEYIAITDHSARAAASRTVDLDALARQREEIDLLREAYPRLAILHGVEVDIMADGRLDFPDEVLASLDIVLASLHDRAGHDGARLTRRCLAAIAHPLVNVITHPANRMVGRDDGYALDFPAIYAAAAETGTALEIDGAPSHLDLDGARARAAVAAGATVVIDSDCHRARLLDRQMRFGVAMARRGWIEARHVLNTRGLAEVRAFVAAKRAGRP